MVEDKQKDEVVVKPAKTTDDKKVENNNSAKIGDEVKTDASPATSTKKKKKKGVARSVNSGRAYVKSTYNNTIVTLTDQNGNVLSWSSAGQCGFKGAKKATPYAATMIVKDAFEKAKKYGLKDVAVYVKGVGGGRESAIRSLNASGLSISGIKDVTPIPHNGCRAKKPRRV